MGDGNRNLKRSTAFHQDVYEMDFSSAAATAELLLQLWELWKGAGVAHRIQPLDQYKDNPG